MIQRFGTVTSTQDIARDLAVGSVVVADFQTAGRGRLDRSWIAPRGTGLHVTLVARPHPLSSLAAGVAAAEACGRGVRLKWPNDLQLDGRKLGGVLVEALVDRHLVGVGVNLSACPPGAAQLDGADRDELLERLVAALAERWEDSLPELLSRWRALSDTLGRRVRVELPERSWEGWAQDIAADGALIVDGTPVYAGDVVHLHQR